MSYILIQQMVRIREEFDVAKSTVDYLERSWANMHREPAFEGLQLAQVRMAAINLEPTYIVRLFSAFEAVLRSILPGKQPDRRSAYALVSKAASKWQIPSPLVAKVDHLREFRNRYVHQATIDSSSMTFTEALASLNHFLSWLPNPP
jgi:hypothetical protein